MQKKKKKSHATHALIYGAVITHEPRPTKIWLVLVAVIDTDKRDMLWTSRALSASCIDRWLFAEHERMY